MRLASSLRVFGLALVLLAPILLSVAAPAQEQAEQGVTSVLTAFKVTREKNGREKLVAADNVAPGDLAEYQLMLTNRTKAGVKDLVATLPIPTGMIYQADTAVPAAVLASLDNKTFAKTPLTREVVDANGRKKIVKVPVSEYRFLRWQVGALAAGKNATTRARAKVTEAQPVK